MMDDIDRTNTWWRAALTGIRGPIDADNPMAGFYRSKNKDKSLSAVAIWYDSNTNELRYQENGRDVDDQRARERWPYVSKRPISAEVFWAFRETGKWIDIDDSAQAPVGMLPYRTDDPANVSLAKEIVTAKQSAAKYAKVESDEEMTLAQSLRAKIQELAGKADKLRTEEKEPHLAASRDVDAKWQPMIKEAKATADGIRKAMQDWNDFKLSQLEAAKKAAEAAVVEDMDVAPPVISNAPMPSTQIRGGGGRAASVGIKLIVTAVDLDKAFRQFRDTPEVMAVLMSLAQKAIDAGLTCEAATVEKKSAIR